MNNNLYTRVVYKMLIFVCGYAGSGKDTLANDIIQNNESRWIFTSNMHYLWLEGYKFKRFSFADKLKRECEVIYRVPREENDKNTPKYILNGKPASARDIWIYEAKLQRDKDPYYYARDLQHDDNYIVTDWRYPNELEYHNAEDVVTIRVFRECVDIMDIPSEHYLDNYMTDFLVVDSLSSLNKCKTLLPQYKNYR